LALQEKIYYLGTKSPAVDKVLTLPVPNNPQGLLSFTPWGSVIFSNLSYKNDVLETTVSFPLERLYPGLDCAELKNKEPITFEMLNIEKSELVS